MTVRRRERELEGDPLPGVIVPREMQPDADRGKRRYVPAEEQHEGDPESGAGANHGAESASGGWGCQSAAESFRDGRCREPPLPVADGAPRTPVPAV